MDKAIVYKLQHPSESYSAVAVRFVPPSTLHDHMTNTHASRGHGTRRDLSIIQEDALLDKINAYAMWGTLLTPHDVTELAHALCGHTLGRNWTSTFLTPYSDKVSSKFYRIQELARLKADTPSNRQAFYQLVSELVMRLDSFRAAD